MCHLLRPHPHCQIPVYIPLHLSVLNHSSVYQSQQLTDLTVYPFDLPLCTLKPISLTMPAPGVLVGSQALHSDLRFTHKILLYPHPLLIHS